MFECFLFAPVHDLESAAEIGNGAAIFKLRKVDAIMWPSLQSVGSGMLLLVHIYTDSTAVCLNNITILWLVLSHFFIHCFDFDLCAVSFMNAKLQHSSKNVMM